MLHEYEVCLILVIFIRLLSSYAFFFFNDTATTEIYTLSLHDALPISRSASNGIPLFGSGDWNDGMNRVGEAGKGESVWLGWFLYTTLQLFAPLAEIHGEAARASTRKLHATALAAALERDGSDGNWYRRGYFDDGTPLGSACNL